MFVSFKLLVGVILLGSTIPREKFTGMYVHGSHFLSSGSRTRMHKMKKKVVYLRVVYKSINLETAVTRGMPIRKLLGAVHF